MAGRIAQSRRGVIFDLDGTLVDTLDDIAASVNQLLYDESLVQHPRYVIQDMIGDGLPALLQRASGIDDPTRVNELVNRFRPLYRARMLDSSCLFDGIGMLLDRIAASGMPVSILSNKPHDFTVAICKALLGRWPFVVIQGANQGVAKKPDPCGAFHLSKEMKIAPEHVVFVGDSAIDVATARNAGMVPIAAAWGFGACEALESAVPAHLVQHPSDLLAILEI